VGRAEEDTNRRMLRARDAMDMAYQQPLDTTTLARIALCSPAHFIRTFSAVFGETPHRYLQRRRVERATFLLRDTDLSVTDVCMSVGFSSLGSFSRTFRDIVGDSPTAYRRQATRVCIPSCVAMARMRPWGPAPNGPTPNAVAPNGSSPSGWSPSGCPPSSFGEERRPAAD
jgi:AraC-like DNA-binding protein